MVCLWTLNSNGTHPEYGLRFVKLYGRQRSALERKMRQGRDRRGDKVFCKETEDEDESTTNDDNPQPAKRRQAQESRSCNGPRGAPHWWKTTSDSRLKLPSLALNGLSMPSIPCPHLNHTGLSKATVFKSSATVWGHTNSPGRGSQDPKLGINFRARNHRQILTKTHYLEPRERTFESTFFEALNSHSHAGASHRPPTPPELTLTNPNR